MIAKIKIFYQFFNIGYALACVRSSSFEDFRLIGICF